MQPTWFLRRFCSNCPCCSLSQALELNVFETLNHGTYISTNWHHIDSCFFYFFSIGIYVYLITRGIGSYIPFFISYEYKILNRWSTIPPISIKTKHDWICVSQWWNNSISIDGSQENDLFNMFPITVYALDLKGLNSIDYGGRYLHNIES